MTDVWESEGGAVPAGKLPICPACHQRGEPVGKPTTHFLHINRHFLCRVPGIYTSAVEQLGSDQDASDLLESLAQMRRGEGTEL